MARILFLDDSDDRWRVFFNHAGHDHQLTRAATAQEAIDALQSPDAEFDLVMLDHDLRDEHYAHCYGEYAPGTGMDVVDFVCLFPGHFRNVPFTIHSLNTERGHEMKRRLEDAQLASFYVPFGWKPEPFRFVISWYEGVFLPYQHPNGSR